MSEICVLTLISTGVSSSVSTVKLDAIGLSFTEVTVMVMYAVDVSPVLSVMV